MYLHMEMILDSIWHRNKRKWVESERVHDSKLVGNCKLENFFWALACYIWNSGVSGMKLLVFFNKSLLEELMELRRYLLTSFRIRH